MSTLRITLIDVGWGDSILIESQDGIGNWHYALVDSNDSTYLRSSFIFLKRHFERLHIKIPDDKPVFDFVFLSHGHSDHGKGLKRLMSEYGTRNFYYPKSTKWSSQIGLIRYAKRSSNVKHHQSIDDTKKLASIGDANMSILWPQRNSIDRKNENNNSIVLVLELADISFVLTGDAEEEVWSRIAARIPNNTHFFKVPHHGSVNGTFDDNNNTPWFDNCPDEALLGISSHIHPHTHPDKKVIELFERENRTYFRTDEHYHITFETDASTVSVKYSHI
jgi:beta-lactamase superfamily II metal-dependent hydrolase